MIQKINNILSPLNVPVLYILRPEIKGLNKTGISYHFFGEGYELHGDGEGNEFGGSVQIDIFSKIDYSNIVEQVRSLMKQNNFRLSDMRDSDDSFSNVRYYHKILIFNYSEGEVK